MKICIATDFHLSYRQYGLEQREYDFYDQYTRMIDEIINEKPDIFIELGDVFDNPYPKPIALKTFEDGLKRLEEANIKSYGIIGNHTLVRRKNFYPIDCIFKDRLRILNEDSLIIDDVFICGINYHPRTDNIKDTIDNLYEKGKRCRLKILLLHQSLKKDQNIGYDFDEEKLELNRFDYVFLGHFHKKILRYDEHTDSVIHYPGSLNSCNVVELLDECENGRGYTVFDTDTYLLEMKTIKPEREYIEYTLTEDELNDEHINNLCKKLSEYPSKPILQLNITAEKGHNIYDQCKKLEKYTLNLKYKITTPKHEQQEIEFIDNPYSIEQIIHKKLPTEWQADFCIELLKLLGDGRKEEAKELADKIYHEHYHIQEL